MQTIFPELKMSAVVLGSRILMITAAKRYRRRKKKVLLQKPHSRERVQLSHLLRITLNAIDSR